MSSKGETKVGDARIEFLLEGVGEAVVLIPGGGLEASYFEDLARRIAGAGFRAVAVIESSLNNGYQTKAT